MDDDRHVPKTTTDPQGKALPLLPTEFMRRPYQAYCVTEASSRSSSPDLLIPKPLKILPASSLSRHASSPRSTMHANQNLATALGRYEQASDILDKENQSKQYTFLSNEVAFSGNTVSSHEQSITPTVAPHANHRPADGQTPVYHLTPLHSRMQHGNHFKVTANQLSTCRPFQQCDILTAMKRPLPPLPIDLCGTKPLMNFHIDFPREKPFHHDTCNTTVRNWAPSAKHHDSPRDVSLLPSRVQYTNKIDIRQQTPIDPKLSNESNVLPQRQTSHQSSSQVRLWPSVNHSKSHQQSPPTNPFLDKYAQVPSTAELYSSNTSTPYITIDPRAQRRTQPKDARLKYIFGHRPSTKFDTTITTTASQTHQTPSLTHSHLLRPPPYALQFTNSTPSLHSWTTTSQPGPRPPPWGSYDNLELRRKTRGEAREREETRMLRLDVNMGSSTGGKGSVSVNSLSENVGRKDVDEFRAQVLSVYPDMEFDGRAGWGGRRGYCCVVM